MTKKHIMGMLVEDRPGVLARISGALSRRGFNIETMTLGKTARPGMSRIVLTITGDERKLGQAGKHVNKLLDVVSVSEMNAGKSIVKELCLIKLDMRGQKAKEELLKYADTHGVRIIDVTSDSVIFQMVDDEEKIDSFIGVVKRFGIREISRTGVTAMKRGPTDFWDNDMET